MKFGEIEDNHLLLHLLKIVEIKRFVLLVNLIS
jgi:hypothetical protein